jgi:hypothetical protein
MCVARTHQNLEHDAFIGLMCRLYLEMREHGFFVACGMMSAPARALMGILGLRLELLRQSMDREPQTAGESRLSG